MKRTALSLLVATVIAGGLVVCSPRTAKADHRRSSFGLYVGSGGVSVGYGLPYRYSAYGAYRPIPVYPSVVVPTCCHYERVYVPEYWDVWGWHPGSFRTYRVCDHHGRVLVY